ncbi:SagB/ThcOx family dehydrogenase [Candidatus Parcubacteria bacterium]|nr:MAG: SagB/ThcOx family dehydrogenase [Candidatus Parcubacteria bacterium]
MDLEFSQLFHQSSKNGLKGHPAISKNENEWPSEWKTTYYKDYPRLPKIKLDGDPPSADFFELIKKRRSRRDFTDKPIRRDELSILLKYSCGNMQLRGDQYRRAQASGGARFPIEVYPIVFRSSEDLEAGLYHYNVQEHGLDTLWKRPFQDSDIHQLFTYPWVKDAAIGIVLTAVFWRNQNKYGERGYRYILLEAGHIGQNIYLASEALGLKCCALGGTRDENLEKFIDIDGIAESVVYGFALGK